MFTTLNKEDVGVLLQDFKYHVMLNIASLARKAEENSGRQIRQQQRCPPAIYIWYL